MRFEYHSLFQTRIFFRRVRAALTVLRRADPAMCSFAADLFTVGLFAAVLQYFRLARRRLYDSSCVAHAQTFGDNR